jgi:hypothetical protein
METLRVCQGSEPAIAGLSRPAEDLPPADCA